MAESQSREYWFIRHGERFDMKAPLSFMTNLSIKRPDTWLTDEGKREAVKLGEKIMASTEGVPEAVVVSPYLRCIQTAHSIIEAYRVAGHIVPMVIEPRIGEVQYLPMDGCYMYPDGVPGIKAVETLDEMISRSRTVATEVTSKYKRAIVVSHAHVVYHLALGALGTPSNTNLLAESLRPVQVPYLAYVHLATNGGALAVKETTIGNLGVTLFGSTL